MMENEIYIIHSPTIPIPTQHFSYEADAQRSAEVLARNHPGVEFSIAKIVAVVVNPLPKLEWSDGREAGDGRVNALMSRYAPGSQADAAYAKAKTDAWNRPMSDELAPGQIPTPR